LMGEEVVLVEAEPTPEGWKLAAPALSLVWNVVNPRTLEEMDL
jgi:hypothetical protein